jgi:Tol biopolymer transport system component
VISVLVTQDVATGRERVVLRYEGRIEAPNWAPSGDWLLVNGGGRLFRVDLARPELAPLDTGACLRCNNDHGFTPDGRAILLSSHRDRGSEIFVMPAGGGEPRLVSPDAPSWWHGISPDGGTIAYVAARGERRVIDVHVKPLAGGEERRLTQGEGHSDGPDYSADGSRIYWNCDRGGHAQIWVMAADGTGQRRLFEDGFVNWFPHPSPCGRRLVYLAYPEGTQGHPADLPVALVLCDPEGGGRRVAARFTGGQGTINVPSWAPDGSAFAYVRYEGTGREGRGG